MGILLVYDVTDERSFNSQSLPPSGCPKSKTSCHVSERGRLPRPRRGSGGTGLYARRRRGGEPAADGTAGRVGRGQARTGTSG